jgi:hypothetical protein
VGRFLAEHRLGIDEIRPAPRFAYQDGIVTMDATEFDETARFYFDELGMNVAYTPHFFYMFGWAYPPKKLFGLEPFTPEWISAFKQAYRLFTDHVREKGWQDKFVYYISTKLALPARLRGRADEETLRADSRSSSRHTGLLQHLATLRGMG